MKFMLYKRIGKALSKEILLITCLFITISVEGGSELSLWTVNANLVRRVQCDSTIHCLAFSNMPEGVAVNSVAAGCQDGVVR